MLAPAGSVLHACYCVHDLSVTDFGVVCSRGQQSRQCLRQARPARANPSDSSAALPAARSRGRRCVKGEPRLPRLCRNPLPSPLGEGGAKRRKRFPVMGAVALRAIYTNEPNGNRAMRASPLRAGRDFRCFEPPPCVKSPLNSARRRGDALIARTLS